MVRMDFIREQLYRKIDKLSKVKPDQYIMFNNMINGALFQISGIKDNNILVYSNWNNKSVPIDIDIIESKSLIEIFKKLKNGEFTINKL
jgi:hypothetical protein